MGHLVEGGIKGYRHSCKSTLELVFTQQICPKSHQIFRLLLQEDFLRIDQSGHTDSESRREAPPVIFVHFKFYDLIYLHNGHSLEQCDQIARIFDHFDDISNTLAICLEKRAKNVVRFLAIFEMAKITFCTLRPLCLIHGISFA